MIYVEDDVFQDDMVEAIRDDIAAIEAEDRWTKKFLRAGSEMYEYNNVMESPCLAAITSAINIPQRLIVLENMFQTTPLLPDPHLVGAGYSLIKNGGELKWHVDFNWNDTIKLHRVLSMIIYIDEPESGGELQFENGPSITPKQGRVVVFKHNENVRHRVNAVVGRRTALRYFFYTSGLEAPEGYHRSLYGVDEEGKPADVAD